MPFEIPKHFSAETRSTIETALEDAWQELSKGTLVEATPTKRRLVRQWLHWLPLAKPISTN